MTQKEKELLLKDLCARLPYGVCVHIRYKEGEPCYGKLTPRDIQWFINSNIEVIKPYLRPMSSMTEEEDTRRCAFLDDIEGGVEDAIPNYIDWLNKKMFAYRNIDGKDMFELGLAIEAPKDMYK